MAVRFIFRAMTEERHGSAARKMLEQAKRKLLPTIFDVPVASINPPAFTQFLHITTAILRPADLP